MKKILSDVLVVSIEQALAAPLCTSRLVDLGARVIKIERAEGDFARGYDDAVKGDSSYFIWTNHGKESLTLDIKTPDDAALLDRLISQADVFIQNLAPGAMARAGFGSEALRERHPKLITCDITGYGEEGQASRMKAYDFLVQAESGLTSVSGAPEAMGRIGVSICDIGAGMTAHAAIVEALLYREKTGKGYGVSVSLFGVASEWMNVPLLQHDYGKGAPKRVGLMHPSIQPYGAFAAEDGSLVIIAIQNEREFGRFCSQILKNPDLSKDPRFENNNARVKNVEELHAIISKTSGSLSRAEFIEQLNRADIAYGAVNSVADLSSHHALKRVRVKTSTGVDVAIAAPPIGRSIDARESLAAPPRLGQHSAAIRAEFGEKKEVSV